MRNLLGDFKLILFLAVLWLVSGAAAGLGIRAYFAVDWITPCSSLNLLFGMILLLLVMRDEQARKRLFAEADEEMPLHLGLVALIAIPVFLILLGLSWWLLAQVFPN